ncbi:MAG: YIP1 family protein [Chloroflexi bacterium]|nr:YIP1 family protein [Chloroflexota bacterium]
MLQRILGVLKLDANTYEEIEADEGATGQAAMVVAIVAVLGGVINGLISIAFGSGSFISPLLSQVVLAFAGWLVWSVVTFFVGTALFGGKATMGEMLRVLGFAQAPGLLVIIPVCGAFVAWIWTIATTFIAVRQGLDLDNTKAALTVVIGFVAYLAVFFVVGLIFGGGAVALEAITG